MIHNHYYLFIVIQLLIYVKVFEHTFILKYHKMFWRAVLFFIKVFKVVNVFKQKKHRIHPVLLL